MSNSDEHENLIFHFTHEMAGHISKFLRAVPDTPWLFLRPASSLIGDLSPLVASDTCLPHQRWGSRLPQDHPSAKTCLKIGDD
eukprot:m.350006 g.350006  ORF g.350006 m.350006 type:complete len:83 (-) comp55891_c0_seq4:616-864(-)